MKTIRVVGLAVSVAVLGGVRAAGGAGWGRQAENGNPAGDGRQDADGKQAAIQSEVKIVVVDVVVTGAKGQPAAGLKKEDFQVSEDGKVQTVSFFEEHTGGRVTPVALPAMPPDVFTNYPTVKTDSVNVLLLDSLNTQALDQTYVRPQMEKYLEAAIAAPNGARLAIFTLGQELRMIRGFTADSAKSLAAVDDPKSNTKAKYEYQLASPARKAAEAAICAGLLAPIAKESCNAYLAQMNTDRDVDRVSMTLQAFQALARYLAPIPGRKNVIWVAGSFPIQFFPDTGTRGKFASPYPKAVRQTAEFLTADQVAVYPIGATGLFGESYLEGNKDPSANKTGKAVAADEADRSFNQIAMELLARDTGGHAFYNANGLSEAMAQAVEEGSNFYTLAYAPANTHRDGKYRKVEVQVVEGNFKLAYRRGYYAENAKLPTAGEGKKRDEMTPLMGFGMPDFAQILYKVKVALVQGAGTGTSGDGKSARYGFDFAITPGDFSLQNGPDGVRRGNMDTMIVAYDGDGKILNSFRKKSEIALDPQSYAGVMRVGLQMHREMDVPEGAVYLRTGIMDTNSGKLGSLELELGGIKTPR